MLCREREALGRRSAPLHPCSGVPRGRAGVTFAWPLWIIASCSPQHAQGTSWSCSGLRFVRPHSALLLSVSFSGPDFSFSWAAAGARMHSHAGGVLSTKGTSDVLLIPAARGSAPFTSGLSREPQEGKPGLYWRKPHFQHLPKVSAGVFCFPHAPLR